MGGSPVVNRTFLEQFYITSLSPEGGLLLTMAGNSGQRAEAVGQWLAKAHGLFLPWQVHTGQVSGLFHTKGINRTKKDQWLANGTKEGTTCFSLGTEIWSL